MEQENIREKDDTLAVYEVSYLLLPSLALEQVPAKAEALKSFLTSVGGAVISDENPILIDLAYPMTKIVSTVRHKETRGYFGWIKFEVSKEGIEKVKKALDANDEILRYLIIRTVRENTLLNGKMKLQKEESRREEEEVQVDEEVPEVAKDIVPEELDKSIDDLVIA
jgi:ribosomal protein S6